MLLGFVLLLPMTLPASSIAATTGGEDSCTGWGGELTKTIDLNLPAALDLEVAGSTKGSVLSSGIVRVPPLSCQDPQGQAFTRTSLVWFGGSVEALDIRTISPGLGLRLKYLSNAGGVNTLPAAGSAGYSEQTNGLSWRAIKWELIRLAAPLKEGIFPGGEIARITLDANPGGTGIAPSLILKSSNALALSFSCMLSVDKSILTLPDTSIAKLMDENVSDSVGFTTSITCPENTDMEKGTALVLTAISKEKSDGMLVGNTGTATGIGIELLDNEGNRLNAGGGLIHQAPWNQGSVSAPGVAEEFRVRMVRLPEQQVEAGTVRGTFTLTLKIN